MMTWPALSVIAQVQHRRRRGRQLTWLRLWMALWQQGDLREGPDRRRQAQSIGVPKFWSVVVGQSDGKWKKKNMKQDSFTMRWSSQQSSPQPVRRAVFTNSNIHSPAPEVVRTLELSRREMKYTPVNMYKFAKTDICQIDSSWGLVLFTRSTVLDCRDSRCYLQWSCFFSPWEAGRKSPLLLKHKQPVFQNVFWKTGWTACWCCEKKK